MPDNYGNLRKLLNGTDVLPDVNSEYIDTAESEEQTRQKEFTPKYNKFMNNARQMVIDDYVTDFQRSPTYSPAYVQEKNLHQTLRYPISSKEELDQLSELPSSPLSPEGIPTQQQQERDKYRKLSDEIDFRHSPILSPKAKTRLEYDAPIVDRNDINETIIREYLKDTNPDILNNQNLDPDRRENILKLLKRNMSVVKGLTGEDTNPWYDSSLAYEDALGDFNRENGKIRILDPNSVATLAHESLHQKNFRKNPALSGGREDQPDLLNAEPLDRAIRNANNRHIPEFIEGVTPEQRNINVTKSGDWLPEGESAVYYNKIRELLDKK